ncbi:hypothetical protein SO802_006198 [Lithocarpus litseifolius]|uniref:histidine--tRNA ligase n=1 Tax=Lithocarpus litseifolius TaxID=425828 RepID=A0AAW2DP65_9ROSI
MAGHKTVAVTPKFLKISLTLSNLFTQKFLSLSPSPVPPPRIHAVATLFRSGSSPGPGFALAFALADSFDIWFTGDPTRWRLTHSFLDEVEHISSIVTFFKRVGITTSNVGFKVSRRKVLQEVLRCYYVPESLFSKVCIIIGKVRLWLIGVASVCDNLNVFVACVLIPSVEIDVMAVWLSCFC